MTAASDGGKISPEVEFGTFLRLPHQSRTFSRPADAYLPSSPPPRPSSPTPASPPSSTVFLHGRPAPIVSRMRQGAPRLGGLGLGGIVEPSSPNPPPLPARRKPGPDPPAAYALTTDTQQNHLAPAIPPVSLPVNSRSSEQGGMEKSPISHETSGAGTGGSMPQRPFLSPEMDKPLVRASAFALDRPKLGDVLKRSQENEGQAQTDQGEDEESEKIEEFNTYDDEAEDQDLDLPDMRGTRAGIGTTSLLESKAQQGETGGLSDRAKLASSEDPVPASKAEHGRESTEIDETSRDAETASIDSGSGSSFATPEAVPAPGDENDEDSIPTLTLERTEVGHNSEEEAEQIAFDGPNQLPSDEESKVDPATWAAQPLEPETVSLDDQTSYPERRQDGHPYITSLADSLASRADKSQHSVRLDDQSPAISQSSSVYNSRAPSVQDFILEDEAEESEPVRMESHQTICPPSILSKNSIVTASPTLSQTSVHLDDVSPPNQSGGIRYLNADPASDYPSPPSSPATSIQGSLVPMDHTESPIHTPEQLQQQNKLASHETIYIEQASHSPIEEDEILSNSTNTLVRPRSPHQAICLQETQREALRTDAPATPLSLASNLSPVVASSPYFETSTHTTPRRSRFSYQGLGLRMPSSIAPKLAHATEDSNSQISPSNETPLAGSRSDRTTCLDRSPVSSFAAEQNEPVKPQSDPPVFPWIQPASPQMSQLRADLDAERLHPISTLSVSDDHNEMSNPSSPSAYAPSSVASTPEISQAHRVPIISPTPKPVVSPSPEVVPDAAAVTERKIDERPMSNPVDSTEPRLTQDLPTTEPERAPSDEHLASAISEVTRVTQEIEEQEFQDAKGQEEEVEEMQNQLSTVGVAVDIGTAVAGALVMGGLAVGSSALRGLAVGWSAWRGASNKSVIPKTEVIEVANVAEASLPIEEKGFKDYSRTSEAVDDIEGDRKAESSVISTEWGEAEFDAPEGFLEEFKRAMQEIGEEDLAANEQAQIDAQLAAYQAASRQHVDAVGSPTPSDVSSTASYGSPVPLAFPIDSRSTRPREISARRAQPETIEEDSADEHERELEDLMASVWDSPSRRSRMSVEFPTRHGFAPPPGLTGSLAGGSPRPTSVISTSSIGSIPASPSLKSPSSPRQPAKLSKTSKGILGFGRSKSTKTVVKPTLRGITPSPSLPGLAGSRSSQSVLSKESAQTAITASNNDAHSQHSKSSSQKTAGRRSSRFSFGGGGRGNDKEVPPVPTIESQIKDTTYISYGSSKPQQRRNSSASSIPTGLYASRDPYLITPAPGSDTPSQAQAIAASPGIGGRNRERTTSSINSSQTSRSEDDLGGALLGRRRSSLRTTSAYDGGPRLTRSSSIVESEKKLYRVRFGNATGGIGLRSVADDEAVRAGGDRYGQRWVGVGRGRYGNLIIKTDEESDMVYAEQVAQIKKKWRAFGSQQSRDWAAVRIDK